MFFLLPVGVDYRARRYPVVTFTLMGICTLVYLATLSFETFGDSEDVRSWTYQYLWLRACHGLLVKRALSMRETKASQ